MRKVIYKDTDDKTKKLMLCQAKKGVFLFGYYSLQDTAASWDHFFSTMHDANECCLEEYAIDEEDWIVISDPPKHCQQDFIVPTIVTTSKDSKTPKSSHIQHLINEKWVEYTLEKCMSFDGLRDGEKLWISGLVVEFENAKLHDKAKAIKILTALKCEKSFIDKMVYTKECSYQFELSCSYQLFDA